MRFQLGQPVEIAATLRRDSAPNNGRVWVREELKKPIRGLITRRCTLSDGWVNVHREHEAFGWPSETRTYVPLKYFIGWWVAHDIIIKPVLVLDEDVRAIGDHIPL